MEGFFVGSWLICCPNNHSDEISGITMNHNCRFVVYEL
jgi:hypothetical protein